MLRFLSKIVQRLYPPIPTASATVQFAIPQQPTSQDLCNGSGNIVQTRPDTGGSVRDYDKEEIGLSLDMSGADEGFDGASISSTQCQKYSSREALCRCAVVLILS